MAFCMQQHMCSLCQYLCQSYRTNGQQPRIGRSKFTPNLKTHGPYSANSCKLHGILAPSFFCLAGTLTVSLKQFCWFRTKLTSMRGGLLWLATNFKLQEIVKSLEMVRNPCIHALGEILLTVPHVDTTFAVDRPSFRALSIGIYEHMWFANGRCVQFKFVFRRRSKFHREHILAECLWLAQNSRVNTQTNQVTSCKKTIIPFRISVFKFPLLKPL